MTTTTQLSFAPSRLAMLPEWAWSLVKAAASASAVRWSLGGLALAFLAADWIGYGVEWFRPARLTLGGWFLEIAGVTTVVLGAWRLERALRPTPDPASLRGTFARFPLVLRHHVIAAGGVASIAMAGRAYATVTRAPVIGVEKRLARLEQWLTDVDARVGEMQRKTDKEIDQLAERIKKETADRTAAIDALSKRVDATLDKLLAGGLELEGIGIFWILVGVTAATIPEVVYYGTRWWYDLVTIPRGWLQYL